MADHFVNLTDLQGYFDAGRKEVSNFQNDVEKRMRKGEALV